MAAIEVKVPDIGDFKDVPVIEVLVKPGDVVKKDDSLVTLESDKATMEVPAPSPGTVRELRIKVGDKVSEGSSILTLDGGGESAPVKPSAPKAAEAPAPAAKAAAPKAAPSPVPAPAPVASAPAPATPATARNWVMIPHVTQFDEADITELEVFRARINEENARAGLKVTPLAFLIKAVVAALKKFPTLNSSLDGDNLVIKHYWNIGFAADKPQGLVVPVIKGADQKGVLEIAKESSELAAKAREGKLGPADMQGGTFSISSLGGIGGTAFTPIINAPEVAILGVSKSAMKPVWNGKEFAPRQMMPLSLSYDHRVIDGALGARFTAHLAQVIADPRRVLL